MLQKIRPQKILYDMLGMIFTTGLLLLLFLDSHRSYAQTVALQAGETANKTYNVNIDIKGNDKGRIFDGLGALSAGASSRLLYDYPEPERSQILDYLFKPNYGAEMQLLKVEIGGDMNSTAGSEASHMRNPNEVNCDRGYEWWLMKEAKKRNPNIKLAALQWGTPGWVEDFWSNKNIEYNLEWLRCADKHNLNIDYMGGWNERRWDADWYIAWDKALEQYDPDIQLIGADDVSHPWSIAEEMTKNSELREAVDIVGEHSLCGWRSKYKTCASTTSARELDKPLWLGEHSTMGANTGAGPLARSTNRLYIQAKVTGNIAWSLISAWYSNLPIADTGLMLAEWPWSGHYQVGKSIWVYAHTTQFTEPGWQYIDSASGMMESKASYVTLKSPDNNDFSIVIETMDMDLEQTVTFAIDEELPDDKEVHLWATDVRSDNSENHFIHAGFVLPERGKFNLTLQPGHLYTVSTTTGQNKGSASPKGDIEERMSLPHTEDFEGYGNGKLARYFSDINGAFETSPCAGGRKGSCYRQVTTERPVIWNNTGNMNPTTVMGDPSMWGDYEVSIDVLLEEPGFVELTGRVVAQSDTTIAGYQLRVNSNGLWQLNRTTLKEEDITLISGNVLFEPKEWHQIGLRMQGQRIEVIINGEEVGIASDDYNTTGQIALAVSRWNHAQFDNVEITPFGKEPDFIPQKGMRSTATTEENPEYPLTYMYSLGYTFTADKAIDGRPETAWHSARTPNRDPLPQSIIIDVGSTQSIEGLTYRPNFIKHSPGGIMTKYNVYLSSDGNNFRKVASGDWPATFGTKLVSWRKKKARYIKLEGVAGENDMVSAGEINIFREYPSP